mgnify:CR=1 FL=1
MAEKSGVQSVERIFQLIEHLAAHPTGVSLQRLAEETGLAKSTVHRLLASLVGLGYVVQDEENGHYRLTLKMFELSSGIVDSMDIMGVAKAHLERLSQRTGEAVHLVIRDGRDIVYIYKTESGPMRMSSRVGLRSPLYCTGVGKAILATLPGDELEDIWTHSNVQKLTDKTITDLEELRSQLVEVRANGYAIDDEEKSLEVVVPEDKLTPAIGKKGQNVKLAARLLGWKVDIFTETRYNEANAIGHGLEQVASVAEVSIEALLAAGYSSLDKLREATDQELADKLTISAARIADLRSAINFLAPIVESTPESSAVELKMPAATESGDAKE